MNPGKKLHDIYFYSCYVRVVEMIKHEKCKEEFEEYKLQKQIFLRKLMTSIPEQLQIFKMQDRKSLHLVIEYIQRFVFQPMRIRREKKKLVMQMYKQSLLRKFHEDIVRKILVYLGTFFLYDTL